MACGNKLKIKRSPLGDRHRIVGTKGQRVLTKDQQRQRVAEKRAARIASRGAKLRRHFRKQDATRND